MNTKETGKLIAKLRKEAGYTQKTLADALYVTDKAVSKWERGICLPDTSLLPKLSMLLDADIEHLIPNKIYSNSNDWQGVLIYNGDLIEKLNNKKIIDYLISYFMLVGITNINIITNDTKIIDNYNLESLGVNIYFNKSYDYKKKMIVFDKTLIFGSNITRLFKSYMESGTNIKIMFNNKLLPIVFCNSDFNNLDEILNNAEIRNLNRGIINIDLNTNQQICDASKFVEIYERNHKDKIADLKEIAKNRGFI